MFPLVNADLSKQRVEVAVTQDAGAMWNLAGRGPAGPS
jgi:hypothetical protein